MQNLEKTVTTRLLHDTFADFGEILSCKVATDKDGNSKGYGFVHFSDPDAAKKAIDEVNGAQLGDSDKVVTVTEFISKQDRGDAKQNFTNVYVKNLPNTIQNEDAVRGLFTEFGTISSAACMKVGVPLDSVRNSPFSCGCASLYITKEDKLSVMSGQYSLTFTSDCGCDAG